METVGFDFEVGTAEGIEADTDIGGIVAMEADNMAGIVLGAQAHDGDFLAKGEA